MNDAVYDLPQQITPNSATVQSRFEYKPRPLPQFVQSSVTPILPPNSCENETSSLCVEEKKESKDELDSDSYYSWLEIKPKTYSVNLQSKKEDNTYVKSVNRIQQRDSEQIKEADNKTQFSKVDDVVRENLPVPPVRYATNN